MLRVLRQLYSLILKVYEREYNKNIAKMIVLYKHVEYVIALFNKMSTCMRFKTIIYFDCESL